MTGYEVPLRETGAVFVSKLDTFLWFHFAEVLLVNPSFRRQV